MILTHLTYNLDGTFRDNVSPSVRDYYHEHMEGPYIAEFSLISGEGDIKDSDLISWFDNRLLTEFATSHEGVEVWRGIVWEMTLELNGEVRFKSIEDMANAVKTKYTGPSDGPVHTEWVTNDESVNRYGRKERIVTANTTSEDEATERANVELQYHASPYTTAIGDKDMEKNRLNVTVVGCMVAANNIQLMTDTIRQFWDDGSEPVDGDVLYDISQLAYEADTTVGDEVRRIIEVVRYWGGWLYALDVQDNDTETVAGVVTGAGAFDRLLELAQLRNSDEEFYRLQIRNDGGVIYRRFSEDVNYLRYPAPRGLEKPDGDKPTWGAKPGIIKHIDTPKGASLPDTWLSDIRLSFAERVVMRDGDEAATFHGRDLDAIDIYRSIEANQRAIEAANR